MPGSGEADIEGHVLDEPAAMDANSVSERLEVRDK